MAAHSQASLGARHPIHNYEYANTAAREGATGLTSDDIGKGARQLDDDTFWILTDHSPVTWIAAGSEGAVDSVNGQTGVVVLDNTDVGAAATVHTHTESDITDLDHTDDDAIHDNVSGEINAITEKTTSARDDLMLLEDSESSNAKVKSKIGVLGGNGGTELLRVGYVTSDWTPTIAQLEAAGNFFTVLTDSGDITITLPAASGYTEDDCMRRFYVTNGGSNSVIIQIASAGTFIDGLDKLVLPNYNDLCEFGGYHKTGVYTFYGRVNQTDTVLQIRRAATWAASNFGTPAAIPFDTQDKEDNDSVSVWAVSPNPSRLTAILGHTYNVNYCITINSTGGATWTLESWLRINGTTEVGGSRLRSGNYGNEDQSMTLPTLSVFLDDDDYIELMLDHSSLTGNLNSALISMVAKV